MDHWLDPSQSALAANIKISVNLLEQVEGAHPAADTELGPAPHGGHAVQLGLVNLGLDVRPPGPEVKTLDGALARAGEQVVLVHLQERGDVLVKPFVGHDRGAGILAGVPHLDEAILISRHGEIGVKTEAGIQRGVVALHPFVPRNQNINL